MIDYENEIFNLLAPELRIKFKGCFVHGSKSISTPSTFPAISIIKLDDPILTRYSTFSNLENVTDETYEIEIVSNLTKGKEQQTKEIAIAINEILIPVGFVRVFNQPVSNTDSTLARRIMRFKKTTI